MLKDQFLIPDHLDLAGLREPLPDCHCRDHSKCQGTLLSWPVLWNFVFCPPLLILPLLCVFEPNLNQSLQVPPLNLKKYKEKEYHNLYINEDLVTFWFFILFVSFFSIFYDIWEFAGHYLIFLGRNEWIKRLKFNEFENKITWYIWAYLKLNCNYLYFEFIKRVDFIIIIINKNPLMRKIFQYFISVIYQMNWKMASWNHVHVTQ